jgi:HAD superfamily, subfamily IIIB (Acid phosphatase)
MRCALGSACAPMPVGLRMASRLSGLPRRVAVIFITGRPDSERDATLINLDHAGYDGWTELRTRPDRDNFLTVQAYKTAERIKVEAEGYNIIANAGDQMSDIDGEHGGCTFKVPNPFYFIP